MNQASVPTCILVLPRTDEKRSAAHARLAPALQRGFVVDQTYEQAARAALEQAEPEAVRYLQLSEPMASPLTLTCEPTPSGGFRVAALESAEAKVHYLYATKRRLLTLPAERIVEVERKAPAEIAGLSERLLAALDDGLNTKEALVEVERFLVAVNGLCDAALRKRGTLADSHFSDARHGFQAISHLLWLGSEEPQPYLERVRDSKAEARGIVRRQVESKIRARNEAREQQDFARADAIRKELSALGVELLDLPSGTDWTLLS